MTKGIRLMGHGIWLTLAWEERRPGTNTWVQRYGLWLEYGTGDGTIFLAIGRKQV